MRAVIQRVSKASVTIDGVVKGQIGWGFLMRRRHDGGCRLARKKDSQSPSVRR